MSEEEPEVNVYTGMPVDRTIKHDPDPFADNDIKKIRNLDGLSDSVKRRMSRIEKKFDSADGSTSSKQLEEQILTAYSTFDVVQPPHNVDYLAALYNLSPILRGAVRAKVSSTVGMGYDIVESRKATAILADTAEADLDAKRKKIRKAKAIIEDQLEACNSSMTFTEVLTRVFTDVETIGYGCLEIARKNTGQIGYIGHIPSKTVRVRRKRDGYVQMIAEKAVFFRNFGDTTTANPIGNDPRPNELIFFVGDNYSPNESYYGVPASISAKQAIAGNEFSARFNLDYFENKALPRYVFVLKGGRLNDDSQRKLSEFFETMKGQNHRTLIVPLPADTSDTKSSFEMNPVETGVQDSSFNNYRKGNLQEILMAYRVPANKLGISEGVDLGSARDLSKNFSETVTRPEQKNIERPLNRIISEWTDMVQIKLKETSLSDDTELSKQDQVYLTLGALTPNDVRRRWGFAPLKNGDQTMTEQQADQANKAAEMQANAQLTRQRDTERAANAKDSIGEARTPKGAGS